MPDVQREMVVPVDLETTWRFVADMNNWAADMPGYNSHSMVSDRESLWQITGDVGILSRVAEIRVLINEWDEPRAVSFTMEGTEEPVSGEGRFSTESVSPTETRLVFDLSLHAGGAMGPIIDVLLGTQLPKIADEFVTALSADLTANAGNAKPGA